MHADGLSRDNHYVTRAYLRQWASGGNTVWTYRTLVSSASVSEWKPQSVKGIGCHKYLYAHSSHGQETDDVERWLAKDVDAPGADVLKKIASEERLTSEDWDALLRFFAVSWVRTPAHFLRRRPQWARDLPKLLESGLRRKPKANEAGTALGREKHERLGGGVVEPPIRVRVRRTGRDGGRVAEAEALIGRSMWQTEIHRTATCSYRAFHKIKWSILRHPPSGSWVTSDDPVVFASVSSQGQVSFSNDGDAGATVAFMPLSPEHILFAQRGARSRPRYATMEDGSALFVQRTSVMHAHRLVFAREKAEEVLVWRPRRVDASECERDRMEWEKYNREQAEAEGRLEDPSTWPSTGGDG